MAKGLTMACIGNAVLRFNWLNSIKEGPCVPYEGNRVEIGEFSVYGNGCRNPLALVRIEVEKNLEKVIDMPSVEALSTFPIGQ